jgi:hypothetical protein
LRPGWDAVCPPAFPPPGLEVWAPLPSPGARRAASPAAAVLGDPPPSPGPSHAPRSRWRRGTCAGGCASLHREGHRKPACGLGRGRRWPHPEDAAGEGSPPRFLGPPRDTRAPLFDPDGGSPALPWPDGPRRPSEHCTSSAPTPGAFTRLQHAAHVRAVHASRRGAPLRHARLASSLLARR